MKKDIENIWWFRDIRNMLFAFGGIFLLIAGFTVLINATGMDHFQMYAKDGDNDFKWWYAYIFAPIVEEFGYRWIPIMGLFALLNGDRKRFDKAKWFFAVFISACFGYWHGNYFNIFIQGTLGFGLCFLYFKNRFGYVSAVLLHFLWNFTVGTILPITGG